MNFDFNSVGNTNFTANTQQYLKPYTINEVTLTKIESTVLKGSKDPNAEYPVVTIEFTGTEKNPGIFTTNIFIPATEEDITRPTYKNAQGHEYQRPSRFENFKYTLMQILQVINPTGAEKVKAISGKIKSMDQFIKLIIEQLKGKEKVVTNLKLVGRNNNGTVYAALPQACGLSRDGEVFAVNFLGDSLFFTAFEESQQKNLKNAKPTPVEEDEAEEEDDELKDLLGDI